MKPNKNNKRGGTQLNLKTPLCRFSFVNIFKPRKKKDGTESYTVDMLFDKEDSNLSEMKKSAFAAAVDWFGPKYSDRKNHPEGFKWPFRDGDKKSGDYPEYAGTIYAAANSKRPVGVVGNDPTEILTSESQFFSGCYGRALVAATGFEVDGNRGVKFYLQGIQVTKKGEPLGGGGMKDLSAEFDHVEDDSGGDDYMSRDNDDESEADFD